MPDLNFQVENAEAVPFAVAPLLMFKVRLTNANEGERIQSVALRCQVQIESTRRKYSTHEQGKLLDLFGEPERWSRTLRAMLWTHTSVIVPPFQDNTLVDLPVPCTFDFNVADNGGLQVEQIPWDREARFRLSVRVWQEMMDIYYPNTAWLCLRRDVFDRLSQYKMQRGIPTWEQALETIIPAVAQTEEEVVS